MGVPFARYEIVGLTNEVAPLSSGCPPDRQQRVRRASTGLDVGHVVAERDESGRRAESKLSWTRHRTAVTPSTA